MLWLLPWGNWVCVWSHCSRHSSLWPVIGRQQSGSRRSRCWWYGTTGGLPHLLYYLWRHPFQFLQYQQLHPWNTTNIRLHLLPYTPNYITTNVVSVQLIPDKWCMLWADENKKTHSHQLLWGKQHILVVPWDIFLELSSPQLLVGSTETGTKWGITVQMIKLTKLSC